jgi:hypothetical protein
MTMLRFWPTEADCLECITPEAENPSDAVFLAVHQEMRFIRRSFHTDQAEAKSQKQLLNEFLRDDPSGRVILPILGESGIGKSHLVRWLKVQLRQREDHAKRHVILIPKSSSLKSVLGRILEGLVGPRYEEIRGQLRAAREQMDGIGAKQRIRAEILTAVERKYDEACNERRKAQVSGKKTKPEHELWYGHGDSKKLPALFGDPGTQDLFLTGTSERPGIISELARHLTQDTSRETSPRRQFEAADFQVPRELEEAVSKAGDYARNYLQKNLLKESSAKALGQVVELLNSIVDDAIAPLATPADTSLSELFYEVRRQLLADGRELVLLVEDFAVLAGVQRALLDAILREGQTGGKTEACMIRTALAVTDGYFFSANLETVQTRAVHGWWIESGAEESEDNVKNQIGNFVAAYVNAARIGARRLETHYNDLANVGKKAPNAMEYLAPETDELGLLVSFGQSADDYSLFPFNHSAICTIADWRLRDQKGRLRFHPRSVINEIILPVVKDCRAYFETEVFPPQMFLGYPKIRISRDLDADVSRKVSDPFRRDQYLYLLQFWGGKPERLADAIIPVGVFNSFGLPKLDGSKTTAAPEQLKRVRSPDETVVGDTGKQAAVKVAPDVEREPLAIRQFVEKINEWRGGGVLGQVEANRIRGWMNVHILHSVNWEAELLRSVKPATNTFATSIYLPRARGNPPNQENAFVHVASDEQFGNSVIANEIFSAIRAMLRYDHHNGWDYDQGDDDYIEVSNFIEFHLVNATRWIRTKYKNVDGSPVQSLVPALLWQARILNVEAAHKPEDASQIDAIFGEPAEQKKADDDQEWNGFLDELKASRKLLQDELLERVAAFQGIGKTPHAVDASQLLLIIQDFRKTWKVSEKFPALQGGAPEELKAIERHINLIVRFGDSRIESRRQRIAEQSELIVAELGKSYNKNELLKDLEEVCSLSEQHGLKGEVTVGQMRKLAERFKDARAKEVGEQVAAIVLSEDLATRMTAIARLDIETHALLVEFANTCSKFLKERSHQAQGKILEWTPEVVEMKKANVDKILHELENSVAPYRKEDP